MCLDISVCVHVLLVLHVYMSPPCVCHIGGSCVCVHVCCAFSYPVGTGLGAVLSMWPQSSPVLGAPESFCHSHVRALDGRNNHLPSLPDSQGSAWTPGPGPDTEPHAGSQRDPLTSLPTRSFEALSTDSVAMSTDAFLLFILPSLALPSLSPFLLMNPAWLGGTDT